MIRKFILSVVVILIIGILFCLSILFTPFGLTVGLRIASIILPGELHYKHASGLIIGPISASNIEYKNKNTQITIKNLNLNWMPSALFSGKIKITTLRAKQITVITHPTTHTGKPFSLTALKLPPIQIKKGKLKQIKIIRKNKSPILINTLSASNLSLIPQALSGKLRSTIQSPYPLSLNLKLTGTIQKYQIIFSAKNNTMRWTLIGDGDPSMISLHTRDSKALQGQLSIQALVTWKPYWNWQGTINGKSVNLTQLDKRLTKKINFSLKTHGSWHPNQFFQFNTQINTPTSSLAIQGKHDQYWNIYWDVNIHDLSTLLPNNKGDISSKGKLTGSIKSPHVLTQLTLQNFQLFSYQARKFTSKINVTLSPTALNNITASGQGIILPYLNVNMFKTTITGSFIHHTLSGMFTLNNPSIGQNTISINAIGSWKKPTLHATINKITLNSQSLGLWHLTQKTALTVSRKTVESKRLCLAQGEGHLCLDGSIDANKIWDISFNAHKINLAQFKIPKIKINSIRSNADIDFVAHGENKKINQASLNINLQPGNIEFIQPNQSSSKPYTFQKISLTSQLDKNGLQIKPFVRFSKGQSLNATILLPHYVGDGPPSRNEKITGSISINNFDLSLLKSLFPDIIETQGKIISNLKLSGTLSQPLLSGQLTLLNGLVRIIPFNVTYTKISANIVAKEKSFTYDIQAYSDKTPFTISGTTQFSSDGPTTLLKLNAKNIRVLNTNEYKVIANPNVTLAITGKKFNLTGTVLIPKAELTPYDFSNTVTLPDDTIIIKEHIITTASDLGFTYHFTITAGKDVTINTHGASGNLQGSLVISNAATNIPVAKGKLSLVNGKFALYGQTLTIKPQSNVNYTDQPLNNPNLDITVTRIIQQTPLASTQSYSISNITVGIHIQGTLQKPKFTFFSSQGSLSQADILSYLILGQPSNASTPANLSILLKATDKLQGQSQNRAVSKNILQTLNFSELGVESQTTTDLFGGSIGGYQSAFVVGRYLSPRIYIRYSHSLSSIWPYDVFQARYILSKRWSLQMESGTLGSGGDILYTIQRK